MRVVCSPVYEFSTQTVLEEPALIKALWKLCHNSRLLVPPGLSERCFLTHRPWSRLRLSSPDTSQRTTHQARIILLKISALTKVITNRKFSRLRACSGKCVIVGS